MKWCRCSECNHKLFMYDVERRYLGYSESVEQDSVLINIKCSSCKKILDITIVDGEAVCHESKA